MRNIQAFIEKAIESNRGMPLPLIGYNSNKFDIPYLRTSFIRNGLNPYFSKKVIYKDLLQLSRKLASSKADFPRAIKTQPTNNEPARISLSLETLSRAFGFLTGKQAHESEADVLLTIELARLYKERFGADIRTVQLYEPASGAPIKRGTLVAQLEPNYLAETTDYAAIVPSVLLDANYRYALWINLKRYVDSEEKYGIQFSNPATDAFFLNREATLEPRWHELAKTALKKHEKVTLNNYFTTSNCDIEQDIYRIDLSQMDALFTAIWEGGKVQLPSRDAQSLLTRSKLARVDWDVTPDDRTVELLKRYAVYRYGGEAKIAKSDTTSVFEPGTYSESFHPSLTEILSELDQKLQSAKDEDEKLLRDLRRFVEESPIMRHAGSELLKIAPRIRPQAQSVIRTGTDPV
jgi:hypothetical protein